jgi:hypothetical protein
MRMRDVLRTLDQHAAQIVYFLTALGALCGDLHQPIVCFLSAVGNTAQLKIDHIWSGADVIDHHLHSD